MKSTDKHLYYPQVSFDGGDLDCGNGLLLLIRKHIDPLEQGQLLEIRSTESSVKEDLPAWCRLTGNELVSWTEAGAQMSFLVSRGAFNPGTPDADPEADPKANKQQKTPSGNSSRQTSDLLGLEVSEVNIPDTLPEAVPVAALPPMAVCGIGSWPRPRWMQRSLSGFLQGRLNEQEFDQSADDAVRLAVAAQERAGVDLISDGEQRRDNYSSFVGRLLDNCELIPLTDLLPLVTEPEKFKAEMEALEIPASEVRHPVVYGPLSRSRGLATEELAFLQSITEKAPKVSLPGPYLLSRTMWINCIPEEHYRSREDARR